MLSGNITKPDLNIKSQLFRVQHYLKVYNLALDLTGSIDAAKELSARVFENAARLFEHHPIPQNCDRYLTAQVYLLYAQKVPPAPSSISTAFAAPSPKAAGAAPVMQAPEPDRLESVCKVSPIMPYPSPAHNAPKANAPVLPIESETVSEHMPVLPIESVAVSGHAPAIVSKLAAREAPLAERNAPATSEVVYDKKHTEFWTPDLEIGGIQLDDDLEDEAQETAEEGSKHSVQLSLLNAFLAIACLASIAFLLSALNILPRLI